MSEPIVIVGGGLAAGTAAVELRETGHDGDVVLLAAEGHVPYERPPLSKGYLLGEKPAEATHVQPPEWYDEHDIDLVMSLSDHVVVMHQGEKLFEGTPDQVRASPPVREAYLGVEHVAA